MMPQKGQHSVTLSEDLYAELVKEATEKKISVPNLIWHFLHPRVEVPSGAPEEEGKGSEVGSEVGKYFVEVSERGHRILTYAQKVYNKPMPEIVEKLIDAPLNVIPLKDRKEPQKEVPKGLEAMSNMELISYGFALLKDFDLEGAEKCKRD